ncbi:MAG: hypothetical protein RLZZ384_1066, partial [Pseudomonadota bacterium]
MRNFIVVCFILFFSGCVIAEDEQIAKIFTKYGVNGTIIISSLDNKHVFIHNDVRANTKFSPASTFKIPNTLIALEEDVILGKDDSIKWDGTLYSYPNWNHDHTLASAFNVSCVWCFQKLAKRVGVDKYHQYLAAINYGELQNPFEVTTFWLDNSLKISPTEQIDFLRKLYQRTLPFNAHSYDTLREIMQVEAASNFK